MPSNKPKPNAAKSDDSMVIKLDREAR